MASVSEDEESSGTSHGESEDEVENEFSNDDKAESNDQDEDQSSITWHDMVNYIDLFSAIFKIAY